jgi:hypothetical protein
VGNPLLNELKGVEFYFFDPKLDPEQVIVNYLFNHPGHLFLQADQDWKVFGLKVNGRTALQMAFHIRGGKAQSPFKAPFGSLQSAGPVAQSELNFFLQSIEAFLTAKDAKQKIIIKHYPEVYQVTNTKLLCKNLVGMGFSAKAEVSSIIKVDNIPFERKIKISERQKLVKSKARFRFQQVPILQLTDVYRFIEACRHQKEHSLSMTLTELQETVKRFENDFFLFVLNENETIAAASIVIRINKRILYTFYYAHASPLKRMSPTVFLLSGIYSFARENRYQLVDLGTSMNGNEINKSLLYFKESVGGKRSPKYIFEKNIE